MSARFASAALLACSGLALLVACSGDDAPAAGGASGGDAGVTLDAGNGGSSSGGGGGGGDAGGPPPPPDAGALAPRLSVSGAQILTPDGKPIQLRGFNWGQWGLAIPQDAPDNVAQGATSVRIPLRWWGDWKGEVDSRNDAAPGHIDPAALAVLDQTIKWATDAKLWTVLFVDSNYGQGAHDSTDNFWTDPAMKQEFLEVWQFLVARYRSTPYIAAYELLPEPQLTGTTADADVKAFYDSLIVPLRTIDPKTPFVVGPTNAYSLHRLDAAYTTVDPQVIYTGDYFIFDTGDELSRMTDITSFVQKHNAPVWINQVGIESGRTDALTKAEHVLSALDQANVGWAWWTYRVHTTDPTTHGIYYEDPSDTTKWLVKPEWLALVSKYMKL